MTEFYESARTVLLNIRISEEERDSWKEEASRRGMSLSDMIRGLVSRSMGHPVAFPEREFRPDFKPAKVTKGKR